MYSLYCIFVLRMPYTITLHAHLAGRGLLALVFPVFPPTNKKWKPQVQQPIQCRKRLLTTIPPCSGRHCCFLVHSSLDTFSPDLCPEALFQHPRLLTTVMR